MEKLIIISGPSGVGKNTLADIVIKEFPEFQYFKKITTRDKRPSDRDDEMFFLTQEEFNIEKEKYKVILPYEVRGRDYGFPVSHFGELKNSPRIICLSDFDLISSLYEAFNTTTVYVKAPIDAIKDRLTLRQDTDEQRRRSIESVESHLMDYKKFRDLFDYEITNGTDLKAAQDEMIEVIKKERLPYRGMYNFLLPTRRETQSSAQYELDNELGSIGNLKSLPTYDEIITKLENTMQPFYYGRSIYPVGFNFRHGPVTVVFYSHKDKERDNIAYGSFELQGPKKDITKTCVLIEELFPELNKNDYRQVRMR
jgi:guanylate kinase